MNTIKVRDIEIGAGAPKIIVPIVGVTKEDILNEAKTFDSIPVDVVEWRVDWFEHVFEFDKVEDVLKELRTVLGNIPLLLTFRTKKEGGEKAIDTKDYKELNLRAAKTGYVDFIDVEIFTGDDVVREIIDGAHAAGVRVIASNHDFFKTPAKSDIIYRLRKMQDMGADIPKIAVMPQSKRDVLTLLCATEYHDVEGRYRCHQPSVRRSIRILNDLRCCKKGIRTRADGRQRSEYGTGSASLRNVKKGVSYEKSVALA